MGTHMLSEHGMGRVSDCGGCLHEGNGGSDEEVKQEHIYTASEVGMKEGTGSSVLWSERGISGWYEADRSKEMRVGTLKTQLGQRGGLTDTWLHVCHVISHVTANDVLILSGLDALMLL